MKTRIAVATGILMLTLLAFMPAIQRHDDANAKPSPAPQGTPASPGAQPSFTPDTSIHWMKMSKDEHISYMRKVVMPKMKAAFSTLDQNKFGKMNCMTCHGKGAKDATFKMPNPDLPKLPNDQAGFQKLMADKPDMMKFMNATVKPEMAALLNEPEHSQKNPHGFGCMDCHTTK